MGKLSQGGQKKRYKDTLKAFLKDFNILVESWEQTAQDCIAMKPKESARLNKSAESAKSEPMDHNRSRHLQDRLALFATGSLEQRLI